MLEAPKKRERIYCSVCGKHLAWLNKGGYINGFYPCCYSRKCKGEAQPPSLTTRRPLQRLAAFIKELTNGVLWEESVPTEEVYTNEKE